MPDLTITMTAPQALRLATVVGRQRGLTNPDGTPRIATVAEVKAQIIEHIRGYVYNHEKQEAVKAVVEPTTFEPT